MCIYSNDYKARNLNRQTKIISPSTHQCHHLQILYISSNSKEWIYGLATRGATFVSIHFGTTSLLPCWRKQITRIFFQESLELHPQKLTWIHKLNVWIRWLLLTMARFGIDVSFLGVLAFFWFWIIRGPKIGSNINIAEPEHGRFGQAIAGWETTFLLRRPPCFFRLC